MFLSLLLAVTNGKRHVIPCSTNYDCPEAVRPLYFTCMNRKCVLNPSIVYDNKFFCYTDNDCDSNICRFPFAKKCIESDSGVSSGIKWL
ncbi:hypothetical protein P8452_59884 [Trifolium repens]|nr:hypothetical protein P8452_59884 [Trifolium repens]